MKHTFAKILSLLTMLYSLDVSPALAQDIRLKTETWYLNDQTCQPNKAGIPFHRTEFDLGDLVFKNDHKENIKGITGATDVSSITLNNFLKTDLMNTYLTWLNVGNFDGGDESFIDVTASKTLGELGKDVLDIRTQYALDLGTSIRKTSKPRQYLIATAKNISITDWLRTSTEIGYLSRDPLQENKDRWYGYAAAMLADEIYVALGNEINASHVIAGLDGENVGNFFWYRNDRLTGDWLIKNRFGAGKIDKGFFNMKFQQEASKIVTIPPFNTVRFSAPWTRSEDITIGGDLNGNYCSTIARIGAGTKIPIGYFALGTDTRWDSHGSNTGAYIGYANTFSLSDDKLISTEKSTEKKEPVTLSVEVNYSGRSKQVDAYIKTNIPIN